MSKAYYDLYNTKSHVFDITSNSIILSESEVNHYNEILEKANCDYVWIKVEEVTELPTKLSEEEIQQSIDTWEEIIDYGVLD